jgi:hypothetical protein
VWRYTTGKEPLVPPNGQKNVKSKVIPVLFLSEHHDMKAYCGGEGITPHILTSALDGVEWSSSHPCRFTTRERAPAGIHWIGGWVGPRTGLDTVVKKIPSPCRDPNPWTNVIYKKQWGLHFQSDTTLFIPDNSVKSFVNYLKFSKKTATAF